MRSMSDPRQAREPEETSVTLDALYRGHADWLGAVLRRRFGHRLCHEDLVQETYARAARLSSPAQIKHPRAFLWKIANRIALDQLRRLRRAERAATLIREPIACSATQTESVLLGELVAGLPLTCRDTFLLSRFAALSYEEIARRQGISVKAVEWRMSQALELLARRLAE